MAEVTTRHAEARARQRGFQSGDIELIQVFGTPTRDGVLVREKDVGRAVGRVKHAIRAHERSIALLRQRISALERLKKGAFLVTEGDAILTLQWARRWKQKRELRKTL
jgi:hypothetical protein